jgi:probable HAF family extracellular repeat protein
MGRIPLLLALAALDLHCLPAQSTATYYTVADLSGLGSGNLVIGWSINGSGEIAGERVATSGDPSSFVFRDNALTTLRPLSSVPDSRAYGVSDAGQVVGTAFAAVAGGSHGYLFNSGTMTDLHPAVSLGGPSGFAAGINNFGYIVGASAVKSALDVAGRHAFLYQNGKLSDLHPAVSFGGVWSEALGINDAGDIVGTSETADGNCYHAFLFRASDHTVVDLHSFVQAGRCSSRANAVNGKGEIVGSTMSGRGVFRAFLYSNGEATDLDCRCG